MDIRKRGAVCAAKNCKNKSYTSKKRFFKFPIEVSRARIWVIASGREDLFDKLEMVHKGYRLCEDHFDNMMFTNHFRNRLNWNAKPTLFPSLEGPPKHGDHTYSMQHLSNIIIPKEEFSGQAGIVQDVPSERMQSQNECSNQDELQLRVNISDDLSFFSLPNLTSSSSTQTSSVLSSNTPRTARYRKRITALTKENKRLKNRIQLLTSSSNNLENITLEQYKMLTKKFCSSPELAHFINVQVSECQENHRDVDIRKNLKRNAKQCILPDQNYTNIST
ncbi:hypothetical protein RN001_011041 [Aquatica leii]|uniref:THAP-type domain-containing protein n=1 Tax=Aquatica leii TaxID=1421715 RepID=A0AAN7SQL9_9COLE|nr:hypothetical protein RN001_011041 [Aquatica leii]